MVANLSPSTRKDLERNRQKANRARADRSRYLRNKEKDIKRLSEARVCHSEYSWCGVPEPINQRYDRNFTDEVSEKVAAFWNKRGMTEPKWLSITGEGEE